MAPLPVIEGVFRVTMVWNPMSGVQPVNVWHCHEVDTGTDPGDALNSITSTLGAHHDMFDILPISSTLNRIVVTKLDGSSASVEGTVSGSFGTTDDVIEPAVAGILSIRTGQRGPRGRGRLYLGPTTEGHGGNGSLTESIRATMQTAWNDFADDLSHEVDTSLQFGVASYVHADFHEAVSIVMEGKYGTQRRRQDQLR